MSTQLNPEAIIDGSVTKEKLSEEIQTSLGKADTALQSYTEQYKGTVTGVKINGTTKNPSSGVVDLGTVITEHQDLSGYQPKLVSGTNIKTINGTSILGSGNIVIEGGAKVYTLNWDGESESVTLSQEEYDNIVEADIVVLNIGGIYSVTVDKTGRKFSEAFGGCNLVGRLDIQGGKVIISISIEISTKLATFTIEYVPDIPTKTSQLENDSDFVSSDGLKTINGESIVGSGDIVISSGSSSGGSGAYAEVYHETSDTTFTLTPNTFHVWDEVASLDLSFGEETSGVANEYLFQFTSGATATQLTLPDTVEWVNGALTIDANKTYQISIVNNIGLIIGV